MLWVATLAFACAGAPKSLITAEDVRHAAETGQLPRLYDRIEADLRSPDLGETERVELELRLDDAGRRLGAEVEAEVESALDARRLPSGRVPLAVVDGFAQEMTRLERWHPSTYARVAQDLEIERDATRREIAAKESELRRLSEAQAAERLAKLDELGALYGAGSSQAAAYAERRRAFVAGLLRDGGVAVERDDYAEALRLFSLVAEIEPKNGAVQRELAQIQAKLFEERFFAAFEQGRPDDAYRALVGLSEAPNFDRVRAQLAGSADALANAFVAPATAATQSNDLESAYRLLRQARDVRTRLGAASPEGEVPAAFVAALEERSRLATEREFPGVAWGCLQAIAGVSEPDPELQLRLSAARDAVAKRAVERVGVAPFEDSHGSQDRYGDVLTAELVQYLRKKSSDDVEIVDGRQEPEALDFLVEGNILEARIDAGGTAEIGVFSVSYRVIDAESATVRFADTQRIKGEVGARAPGARILDPLARDISGVIGARLAELLASPDARYEEAGDRLAREGDYVGAADQLAYALVRRAERGGDTDALRDKLVAAAFAAEVRPATPVPEPVPALP